MNTADASSHRRPPALSERRDVHGALRTPSGFLSVNESSSVPSIRFYLKPHRLIGAICWRTYSAEL